MQRSSNPIRASEPFPAHDPAYLADPYAYLRGLREAGRVVVDPGTGKWFLLRYDDVSTGLAAITREERDLERRHRPTTRRPSA